MASEVRRTGFGGKSIDVNLGDLIVSSKVRYVFFESVMVMEKAMNGEKTDVGRVAKKLARKTARASGNLIIISFSCIEE
ncbi:hypothetical protein PAENIP36_09410 [Paenibacillus sp. P36]